MKKEKCKILLRTAVLSVLIIIMISVLNTFFQPTWLLLNNYYTMKGFYEEPDNRIETLFLGASVGAYGFSPMELYREYGLCAYTVATQEQPLLASYYWIKETHRLHSATLKNVILDVSEFRKAAGDSNVHAAIDGMKLSPVKIRAAGDYADRDFTKTLAYILPLTTYHSRWTELEEIDFNKYSLDKVNGTRGQDFTLMTYRSVVSDFSKLEVLTTVLDENAEPVEFPSEPMHYFNKILEFCNENGITLTLVKTPTDNWNSSLNRGVQALADKAGLTFLDFNFSPLIDEIGYIHPYDSRESKHVNFYGSKKMMKYIGQYLTENCTATDVRGNEDYEYLAEQYDRYDAIYYKQFEMNQATDVAGLIKAALGADNTVLVTVKDEGSNKLTDAQREYFGSIGLQKLSALGFRNSYIGVISPDGVVYEATKENNGLLEYETVLENKTKISLSSGKIEEKNQVSCLINGNEEVMNFRGINIVVYNNTYDKVVYSTSFDTYTMSEKKIYRYDFNTLIGDPEAEEKYKDNSYYKDIVEYIRLTEEKNAEAREKYQQ